MCVYYRGLEPVLRDMAVAAVRNGGEEVWREGGCYCEGEEKKMPRKRLEMECVEGKGREKW